MGSWSYIKTTWLNSMVPGKLLSWYRPVCTVYPKKYAHGFVVLCFVVVMQSFIMNSHEVFIHIHQGCFAGTGAIVRLPQCQWSKPDGYGIISQYITTTKHSKAKTVCIFLGIYCMSRCLYNTTIFLCIDCLCLECKFMALGCLSCDNANPVKDINWLPTFWFLFNSDFF